MKNKFLTLLCCAGSVSMFAQISVTPVTSVPAIGTFLSGMGVTISNVTYVGDPGAIGYFSATNTTLGMNGGLVMTTGSTNDVPGPNNNTMAGIDNMQPGDSDLTALAGCNTYNAAVLEFDCVPSDDTLYFNFLFGSEEYMEWVAGGFNDVFAIFISGPNIPFQNMAWIPNTTVPVSVLNVNANTNPAYYLDHTGDPYVQYDGTTTNMLATIPVVPSSTYHIKIAIADALDGFVDGGVFLEVGSFRTSGPAAVNEHSHPASELTLFPSPAKGSTVSLNVGETSEPVGTVNVYSLSGQVVISQVAEIDLSGVIQLDISSLEPGLYVIEVMYGDKVARTQLPVVDNN